ncbi:MAG: insulinase family protein [Gemmatimonadota bacterium]
MSRPRPVLVVAVVLTTAVAAAASVRIARSQATPGGSLTTEQWPELSLEVHELVLDNGFTIVIVQDARVPRVAASLWYRVGGLQERQGEHGATHFLEHAIHQGTTTIGVNDVGLDRRLLQEIHETELALIAERNGRRNELRERDIFYDEAEWPTSPQADSLRRRLYALEDEQSANRTFWPEYNWYREAGGIMRHGDPVPANTGNELMRIEVDLPRSNLELFFRLEADRMANAVLRGFEAQRFTVYEQFLNINRNDRGRFSEALNGATGIVHPNYLHPGGHMRDHAFWDRTSMLRMYDDYFVPNNATLALVGDVDIEQVRTLANEYFGRVPRGPEPPANMDLEADPPPGGTIRLDWSEPQPTQLTVQYRIPGVGHPDRPAFDAAARLLGGANGILAAAAAAVGAPSAGWSASASMTGSPTRLSIQARASRDADLPALERAVQEAVDRLRRGDIDGAALARINRGMRLDWDAMRTHRGDLASEIGAFAVMDEWRTLRSFSERRHAATAADIERVAGRYLVPRNRVIGTTRQNPEGAR